MIATLHKHGYTFIDESNIKDFGDFMDKLRDRKKERLLFPSGDAADFFVEQTTRGVELPVDAKDLEEMFDEWLLAQK